MATPKSLFVAPTWVRMIVFGESPERIDLARPTVIVIGAEGRGLRRLTRTCCDAIATIPLGGLTESLNAATAAAILVYEAARQRAGTRLAENFQK